MPCSRHHLEGILSAFRSVSAHSHCLAHKPLLAATAWAPHRFCRAGLHEPGADRAHSPLQMWSVLGLDQLGGRCSQELSSSHTPAPEPLEVWAPGLPSQKEDPTLDLLLPSWQVDLLGRASATCAPTRPIFMALLAGWLQRQQALTQ